MAILSFILNVKEFENVPKHLNCFNYKFILFEIPFGKHGKYNRAFVIGIFLGHGISQPSV